MKEILTYLLLLISIPFLSYGSAREVKLVTTGDVYEWNGEQRPGSLVGGMPLEKEGWGSWLRGKFCCRSRGPKKGSTPPVTFPKERRVSLMLKDRESPVSGDAPPATIRNPLHLGRVQTGGTGGSEGFTDIGDRVAKAQSAFREKRGSRLERQEDIIDKDIFSVDADESLKIFAGRVNQQILARFKLNKVRLVYQTALFILAAGFGYAKLVVADGNLTFSFMPVLGMDPILEHNRSSHPNYSQKTDIFLTTYLPYINFAFLPPYAMEVFDLFTSVFNKIKYIKKPLLHSQSHDFKRNLLTLSILVLGAVNSGLEVINYYQVQKAYRTLGRNGVAIPFFCISFVWEYYIRLSPLVDRAFLRVFAGKTPEISKMRRNLYELSTKAEWVVHKRLLPDPLEDLYRILNGDTTIHRQENIPQLAQEMANQISQKGYGDVQGKIDEHLPQYLGGELTLDQFLDRILDGLTPSNRFDAKVVLSKLTLFSDPQTLELDQRAVYKLLSFLMLGEKLPPLRMDAYPEAHRDHRVRQGLLWTGRLLGVGAMYGFTMAWHYALGQLGIEGPGNWFMSLMLSPLRIGGGNMLGKSFVNIYDRFTDFRYPSEVNLEHHEDPYVNQSGIFRKIFSIINGGLFPLVILNQSLRGAGFNWKVDIETIVNTGKVEVAFDPDNVPFIQAFLPLIPMILVLAAPDGEEFGLGYAKIENALQRLPWFRKKRKDGLHRSFIIKWISEIKKTLIYAPDEVIIDLHRLVSELSTKRRASV